MAPKLESRDTTYHCLHKEELKMSGTWIVAFLLVSLCKNTQCNDLNSKRTLYGGKALLQDFPGMVYITMNTFSLTGEVSGHCSGTLLDEYTILTAAHCIAQVSMNYEVMYDYVAQVQVGIERPYSIPRTPDVIQNRKFPNIYSFVHPGFLWGDFFKKEINSTYDIAIIKTKIPFQLNSHVQTTRISLNTSYDFSLQDRDKMYIVSYSYPNLTNVDLNNFENYANPDVRPRPYPVLNAARIGETCSYHRDISHRLDGRSASIRGDSGGPLVTIQNGEQPLQIGIISQCGIHRSYYASTFTNRDFIQSRMGSKLLECGIPDYVDLTNMEAPVNEDPFWVNIQFVWLLPLVDDKGLIKCLVIHLSYGRLLATTECLDVKPSSPKYIAGVLELQAFRADRSRLLELNYRRHHLITRNGITTFQHVVPLAKWFYTRPICSNIIDADNNLHRSRLYAIGYHTNVNVSIVEQSFLTKMNFNGTSYLCTKNKVIGASVKVLPTIRFSLTVLVNKRFHLIGIGAPSKVTHNCANSFKQFL